MKKPLAALLGLLLLTPTVSAEVLLIDAIAEEPPNDASGLLRPKRGSHMQSVEARFGKPLSTHGPVGEPSISRWDYPAYSVYFENDTVLDTVIHRQ